METQNENFEEKSKKKYLKDRFFSALSKITIGVIIAAVIFGVGFEAGKRIQASVEIPSRIPFDKAVLEKTEKANNAVDFSLFWEAWDNLKERYVEADKLDANKLLYGSIKGMLQSTGDPYNAFFNPEENKKFDSEITGNFEGIGAEIGMKNNVLTIIAPLKDSPAEKAGIKSGDKILKISEESTENMPIDEAIDKIRGGKGTEVKLTIFRPSSKETKEITIKRGAISVKSVKFEFKGDIPIIEISRFGQETATEFGIVAKQLAQKKPKGIIIDLRNDPGGYLDASIGVASRLIPKDKVVLIEENSKGERNDLVTRGGDLLSDIRTVVLINEGSASASEILAGAMREDRENVTLVGKKTFGKGSVQEFIPMPYGTAMKVTVARWLTPSGKQINNEGIHPDIEVELTEDDFNNNRDPQLDKALEILK